MVANRKTKKKSWVNRKKLAELLEITVVAFDRWGVAPVARVGRELFFTIPAVLKNRTTHILEQHKKELKEIHIRHIEEMEQMTCEFEAKLLAKSLEDLSADADEELNPVVEKALLDRARRQGQEIANEVKLGRLFPTEIAGFVIARMGVEIAAILESLPGKIKRQLPMMTATDVHMVQVEIAKCRNAAANVHELFDEFIGEYCKAEGIELPPMKIPNEGN